jgi:hypothetical protein
MGTKNFFKPMMSKGIQASGLNLEARAGGAGAYAARAAGTGAQKDIAAAQSLYKSSKLGPTRGDAASNAPGPKKV